MVKPFTPYPEVNILLETLEAGVQEILANHLVGMYLFGSLAAGGFDAHSDIDVMIVTDEEVTEDQFTRLAAMHELIAAGDSVWAIQLECSYIPQSALRRYDPAHCVHPHFDRGPGEKLHRVQHDSAWLVQRTVLRENGVVLRGPDPRTLIDPVSPADLRQAMREGLQIWAAPIAADPTRIRGRGYQSYTVLSLCRILYTLTFGTVTSKLSAARWAQETLGEPWASLIERAWTGRQNPSLPAEPEDIQATLDFIQFVSRSVNDPLC